MCPRGHKKCSQCIKYLLKPSGGLAAAGPLCYFQHTRGEKFLRNTVDNVEQMFYSLYRREHLFLKGDFKWKTKKRKKHLKQRSAR